MIFAYGESNRSASANSRSERRSWMKKLGKFSKKFYSIVFCMLYMIIISVVVLANFKIMHFTLKENAKQRAFDELRVKVRVHTIMTESSIKKEFAQLHVIESILSSEDENGENQFDTMWDMLEQTEKFTMLGFADMSGEAIDYKGERIGNISEKSYFKDIVQGDVEEKCVYLETTFRSEEPELLYAIPVYRKGEMRGILFKTRAISKIKDTVIKDIQFDGEASMFAVNLEGDILSISNAKDVFVLTHNLFEDDDDLILKDISNEELKKNLEDMKTGECIFKYNDKIKYAVYTPSILNGWTIFGMVDKDIAISQYEKSHQVIKRSMIVVTVMFIVSLVLSILFVILHIKKQKNLEIERYLKYDSYDKIMEELTCPVFKYSIEEDKIIANKKFQEFNGYSVIDNFFANSEKWIKTYPEFNFEGLITEIKNVIQNQKIVAFESVLQKKNKKAYWLKIILVPVSDDTKKVLKVFGAIMDTTQEHETFEETVEMMACAPTGLHRCYLNEPIHDEYVSEGFQRMLGYSAEEINTLIGSEGNYSNLLLEQDREKYEAFITRLSKTGESDTCEYRMVCKDGSLLTVSDTMEVKYSSDGMKYGYAVVTDNSKYQEAQEQNEKKLKELRIQLNESRIKISTGQMQPHFLYNALASIREVVLENPEYASDLIFDFTTHLRACIKSMASEDLIPFSQEIENIKAYVSIEKMRFGDKMQVKYDILESDFSIVPLSIQPLVENAIRHGIYERGKAGGIVIISSYCDENSIIIKVEDNGVGFDVTTIKNEIECKERDSTGLCSLIFRFKNLMNANVEIESEIGEGTRIIVRIPMKGEKNIESNYCR